MFSRTDSEKTTLTPHRDAFSVGFFVLGAAFLGAICKCELKAVFL